jgi:hypothetical protein
VVVDRLDGELDLILGEGFRSKLANPLVDVSSESEQHSIDGDT